MTLRTIVIDSSVALKWLLPDEEDDASHLIQEQFRQRNIQIAVPLLFFYEVGNVLKTTAKSLRLDPREAVAVYNALQSLNFLIFSSKELFNSALNIAIEKDISHYDASYVALSDLLEVDFYTADVKLINKMNSPLVKHLSKYGKEI